MESIVRNVRDIAKDDRHAIEHVVGRTLNNDQRLVIQIITADKTFAESQAVAAPPSALPLWCHVYDGLSNEEIADVERIALNRADLTRTVE